MPANGSQIARDFSLAPSRGSLYLATSEDIDGVEYLLPYAHYLRQAWTTLKLSGVLCVDGRPTVYFCERARFTSSQKRELHRFAWNQGLVPILILATPEKVEVHSCVKNPTPPDDGLFEDNLTSLIVPALDRVSETLECARLARSVESGKFFQDNRAFFQSNETVDSCLIESLSHSAKRLTGNDSGWDFQRAHALLGRVLFISFLEKREFIKPQYYPDGYTSLLDILSAPHADAKRLLYREFFPRLKREFNGTLFDSGLAAEEREIRKVHLEIVRDFLNGTDMETGQMTLKFWAYDFAVIPVETISAIYEEFLKVEDPTKKRKEGAYYTPRHLAETVLNIAIETEYRSTAQWKVLDPACGSGIFLVAMFNLFAEQWLRANAHSRKETKAQALLEILQNQIRGVDKNLTACRITTFSLYLALFEKLRPIDVDEFKEKVRHGPFLPPLLWDSLSEDQRPAKPVVMRADFLQDRLPIIESFDLVVGNPPWESRGRKQIALQFVKQSAQYIRDGGLGCLLLPSTILVNRQGSLDESWFRNTTVEKIVQLADFRRALFEATHPCFIIRYRNQIPPLDHVTDYDTPKLNLFDRRRGVIVVEPDDQKSIRQIDILGAALEEKLQNIWLQKFWGTPRDETFLRRLESYPRLSELVGLRGRPKRWLGGTGFQKHVEGRTYEGYEPTDNPYPLDDPFLDAKTKGIEIVLFRDQFTTVGEKLDEVGASKEKVLFARSDDNFRPPLVVYSKGFTKSAFSSYKVRFFDSLRSITAQDVNDTDLLRFLAAMLNSRLFKYIVFHTGSNMGIGRDQLHVYEALNLPFPLPDHELVPANASEIVAEAAGIVGQLERDGASLSSEPRRRMITAAKEHLERLVQAYFAVTEFEGLLIGDTLDIFQPSIHKSDLDKPIASLAFPEPDDRQRYGDTLCDVLNRRGRKPGIRISAQGMASERYGLVFMTILFGGSQHAYEERGGEAKVWRALDRVRTAARRESGRFSYLRGFTYFEHDRLHILKPATMRNWCRTAALNDADAIFEHLNTR